MRAEFSPEWLASATAAIAEHAERELEALVAVSSPSGDAHGAEEMCAVVSALLPGTAAIERIPCSTAGHAPDLLATLEGTGGASVLLLGHLDTVHAHDDHRPLERSGERLVGSGAVDMKGGIGLALGVIRALAETPEAHARLSLLAVNDEEWRIGEFAHGRRFADYDACLCFEAGERGPGGEEGLICRRKAAGTLRVRAHGVAAHSGSAPESGRNALLALGEAARRVAALGDPRGPERLTAVPTVLRAGDAFNVVPANGELVCDMRADRLQAFEPVLAAIPESIDGVELEPEIVRRWPGMDTRATVTRRLLSPAAALLGRPLLATERGGASDASHLAAHVPLTIDGLGPRGGKAHHPDEFVFGDSLRSRAAVALAITAAALSEI
ncbi:MAG: M20/M25/M40 family metallo-hydrolase [Solirubrobacterales bacterium]